MGTNGNFDSAEKWLDDTIEAMKRELGFSDELVYYLMATKALDYLFRHWAKKYLKGEIK